jgi:hypothetical protein
VRVVAWLFTFLCSEHRSGGTRYRIETAINTSVPMSAVFVWREKQCVIGFLQAQSQSCLAARCSPGRRPPYPPEHYRLCRH